MKIQKAVAVGLVALTLSASLAGCGSDKKEETTAPKETKIETTTTESTGSDTESKIDTAPKPSEVTQPETSTEPSSPATTEPLAPVELTDADYAYLIAREENSNSMSQPFQNLSLLFSNMNFGDDNWNSQVKAELDKLQQSIDQAQTLVPTENTKSIHEEYMKGVAQYDQMVDKMNLAIDTESVTALYESLDFISKGTEHVSKTNEMVMDILGY